VKLRTVDTDVIVIGISMFEMITDLQKMWIDFGTGENRQFFAIHELNNNLGQDKAKTLAFFHLQDATKCPFLATAEKLKLGIPGITFLR